MKLKPFIAAIVLFSIIFILWWKSDEIMAVLQQANANEPNITQTKAYTSTYDETLAWLIQNNGLPDEGEYLLQINGGSTLEKILVRDYHFNPFYRPVFEGDSSHIKSQGALAAVDFWYTQYHGLNFYTDAQHKADSIDKVYDPLSTLVVADDRAKMTPLRTVSNDTLFKAATFAKKPSLDTRIFPDTLDKPSIQWENQGDSIRIQLPKNENLRLMVYWDKVNAPHPYADLPIGWILARSE